ncbi:hypothetical protein ACTWPT_57670 [Nonomuraea sp. 3N208]|uniref:hypothetical protein n=1 Tax=Nonomuraea sp. 3N208 TaxID=3457421 RepID=UPI003FCF5006
MSHFPELGAQAPWHVVQMLLTSATSRKRPDIARDLLNSVIEHTGDERARTRAQEALQGLPEA